MIYLSKAAREYRKECRRILDEIEQLKRDDAAMEARILAILRSIA